MKEAKLGEFHESMPDVLKTLIMRMIDTEQERRPSMRQVLNELKLKPLDDSDCKPHLEINPEEDIQYLKSRL